MPAARAHSVAPPVQQPHRSLAVRAQPGAFAAVYTEHHQALYRYCRSILGHDEDARDALQSTLTRAYAALQTEERDFELRPWLFRIAHNESISLLRLRRPTADLGAAEHVGEDSLEQQVGDREQLALLQADLHDLPDRQRAALVMRELSGLSHDEIAVALELTPRTVKQTIFEARRALHQCREGRDMACDDIRRALSDADGRVLRGRRVRAHLRSCDGCRDFGSAMRARPQMLSAMAPPLPAAAGAALLAHLLPGAKAATVAASSASASAAGVGGVLATKATVAAVVVACAAGGATVAGIHAARHTTPRPAPPAALHHAAPATGRATAATKAAPAAVPIATGGHRPSMAAQRRHAAIPAPAAAFAPGSTAAPAAPSTFPGVPAVPGANSRGAGAGHRVTRRPAVRHVTKPHHRAAPVPGPKRHTPAPAHANPQTHGPAAKGPSKDPGPVTAAPPTSTAAPATTPDPAPKRTR